MNNIAKLLLLVVVLAFLHGCGTSRVERDGPPARPVSRAEIERIPEPVPRVEKARPANLKPYTVLGKTYYPLSSSEGFVQRGIASWYGKKFHGRRTANGETYDMYAMTAAHTRLPLPSYVEVKNLANGRSVTVRVNDRGPFSGSRIIDLSYAAASKLGFVQQGTAQVEIRSVGHTSVTQPVVRAIPSSVAQSQTLSSDKRIYLQIAAFYNPDNAHILLNKLQAKTQHPLRLQTRQTQQGLLYRLQAGPLQTVHVAQQLADELRQLGINQTQVTMH